tara:strand:+ start:1920 stop:2642 length:723 start_codon:yes stop_codon:yes gene_type:complete
MKTLIYQINVGNSTQWGSDKIKNILNEYCIPSVKSYAKKHNYHYRMFKEDIFFNYGKNFLNSKGTQISFNKYLYLKYLDYDQIVYIDTDVYILEDSEKLPQVNKLSLVAEPESCETHSLYKNYYKLNDDFKYLNSGFFICDKKSANLLSDYMINRIKFKKKGNPKNTDNGILNEYIFFNDNKTEFKILDDKWNFWPHYSYLNKIKPNIIHFAGGDGSEYLSNLNKSKENLRDFLENSYGK